MPSAKITTTTPFADYTFRLKATNQQGDGAWSMESAPAQFNYNKATGGSTAEYDNWQGNEGRWKVHTFTAANTTFNVTMNPQPFTVVWIAAGGKGGSGFIGEIGYGGKAGGGGGAWENTNKTDIGLGDHNIKVGQGQQANYSATQDTVAFGATITGGMHGCHTGCPQNAFGCPPEGVVQTKAGTYGGSSTGGRGGGCTTNQTNPYTTIANKYAINTNNYGKGSNGTGQDSGGALAAAGKPGIVLVAYRIG